MKKPKNCKTKVAPMTREEHDDLAFAADERREEEAFEEEVNSLDRSELIQLILRDREHMSWLWSTLLQKNEELSRRKRKELQTKKVNYESAKVFGVRDFSALVLQAVEATSNPSIRCVRAKLIELRLKDPSNRLSEAELVRHSVRELTSEKLRTIKRQLKPVPF